MKVAVGPPFGVQVDVGIMTVLAAVGADHEPVSGYALDLAFRLAATFYRTDDEFEPAAGDTIES